MEEYLQGLTEFEIEYLQLLNEKRMRMRHWNQQAADFESQKRLQV